MAKKRKGRGGNRRRGKSSPRTSHDQVLSISLSTAERDIINRALWARRKSSKGDIEALNEMMRALSAGTQVRAMVSQWSEACSALIDYKPGYGAQLIARLSAELFPPQT